MSQHHAFAVTGIDPNKFREIGVKRTTEDPDLEYFVHDHPYRPYKAVACNARCQLIKSGIVATGVTQMELHDAPSDV